MEQTSYVWVKFFGNVKIAKRNNFQITSRHFQVTPTFRISSPRLIGGGRLFNFSTFLMALIGCGHVKDAWR